MQRRRANASLPRAIAAPCLAAALSAVPVILAAQHEPLPLHSGDRVRVTAARAALDAVDATVVAITGDTLVIRHADAHYARGRWIRDSATTAVPLEDLTRLEVSVGRRSNIDRGIRTGLYIGTAAGLLIGVLAATQEGDYVCDGAGCVAQGTLGGALWGVIIGAAVGAFSSRDVWREAALPPPSEGLRVSLAPAPRGFGLAASVRF